MFFSYTLIKKYLPQLKNKEQLIDALNFHIFEAENAANGAINISIPTNRYSDAASHIGVARETAAVLGFKTEGIPTNFLHTRPSEKLKTPYIKIKNGNLCSRYIGEFFRGVEIGPSPEWVIETLKECGMRSVNNVVDIMNYAMLETGQPLHAFDADKIKGGVIIRRALRGEEFISIDDEEYTFKGSELVIADEEKVLAVAGVKGGKSSAVSEKTSNILVESANFDGASIYRTSREMGLVTDASLRFSHNIDPILAEIGLERAFFLIKKILKVDSSGRFDTSPHKPEPKNIVLDIDWLNGFLGTDFSFRDISERLKKLGFIFEENRIEVPVIRKDIETREDLAEEAVRLSGLNKLKSMPPKFIMSLPKEDEIFIFNEIFRSVLTAFGYDEIYTHSFTGSGDGKNVEVDNFISEEKRYLRKRLSPQILENVEKNTRFFDEVRLFELGKTFSWENDEIKEKNSFVAGAKIHDGKSFYELKGIADSIFGRFGILDYAYVPEKENVLSVHSRGKDLGIVSCCGEEVSFIELDVDLIIKLSSFDKEFKQLPKYPLVIRDISFILSENERIGEIISAIKALDTETIRDLALVDEYFPGEGKARSVTLRIVFRADEKTLSAGEVNEKIGKITKILESEFKGEIR